MKSNDRPLPPITAMPKDGFVNELALFAGAGGGILGGHLLGWRTVCAVEWEPYPASVLVARQNDGILPAFPIWDDVKTFDGRPWRGLVDVVSGGFPCQDISAAGGGAGIDGERSGMWKHMARIVGEVRPRLVFVENSPLLVGRGLAVVCGDLTDLGYDTQWFRLSASDCRAPHQRDRCWLVAHPNGSKRWPDDDAGNGNEWRIYTGGQEAADRIGERRQVLADTTTVCDNYNRARCERKERRWIGDCGQCADLPNTDGFPAQGLEQESQPRQLGRPTRLHSGAGSARSWYAWPAEPDVGRVADGVAARVDRLKALGNGQVPRVAAAAFSMLTGR